MPESLEKLTRSCGLLGVFVFIGSDRLRLTHQQRRKHNDQYSGAFHSSSIPLEDKA
jgi:hypothetical protein